MFIILVLYVSWKIKFNYLCWILYKVIFILNKLFYFRLNIEYLKNICRIIVWNIKEFWEKKCIVIYIFLFFNS